MAGVAVGTMALVIVLSVFNGLEDFIRSLYLSFDPDIKIVPVEGKSFIPDEQLLDQVRSIEGVDFISEVIEDNTYVRYRDAEMIVTLKGVDDQFLENDRLKKNIVEGDLYLKKDDGYFAVLGRGVQYTLNINQLNDLYPLQFFYPRRSGPSPLNPAQALNRSNIMIAGVFAIEKQFDLNYILVPLDFAENLMDYRQRRTSLEVMLNDRADTESVKKQIKSVVGPGFDVLDSDEQHSSLIRAIKIEKLFVFITFSFIIAVAAINIFFSLTMLAIDKRKDISILLAMGSGKKLIRSIFINEGAIISFSGAMLGMILGIIFCLAQQQFGLISLGIETSVIDAYPVKMQVGDFLFTAISIIVITLFFSSRPAILAARTKVIDDL